MGANQHLFIWRISFSLGVLLCCSLVKSAAQNTWKIAGKSIPELNRQEWRLPERSMLNFNFSPQKKGPTMPDKSLIAAAHPDWFSVEKLPFFCKIEEKMTRNLKFPVKFRLGEVQYVEQVLEGKY
jgi:hypothetical protein